MNRNRKIMLAIGTLLLVLALASANAYATNIWTCQNITASGTYTVNGTITGNQTNGACLNITASDVTLDCQNYKIVGNWSQASLAQFGTVGIYSSLALDNLTIKNCYVTNYSTGIYNTKGITNFTINNDTLYHNWYRAFYLTANNNTTINNSRFINITNTSTDIGYVSNARAGSKIVNSNFSEGGNALYLSYCYDTLVSNSTFMHDGTGIWAYANRRSNITNSSINNITQGIYTNYAKNCSIDGNSISDTNSYAVEIEHTTLSNISNNAIHSSPDVSSLFVFGGSDNLVNNNTINVSNYAISDYSLRTNVTNNHLYSIERIAIRLYNDGAEANAENNTISGNVIDGVADYFGIDHHSVKIYGAHVFNNTIKDAGHVSWFAGCAIAGSDNWLIENNTITWSPGTTYKYYGIVAGNDSTIRNNYIYGGGRQGIRQSAHVNITIEDNRIINCTQAGIWLGNNLNNTTIRGNNLTGNAVGINISNMTDENNIIYNNYFSGNTINAYDPDPASSNKWNITKTNATNIIGGSYIAGNYWDDYLGVDNNGDYLGDTLLPYNASGNISFGGDYAPLVTTTTIPLISILSPPNASQTYNTSPIIQYIVDDPDNTSVSCTLFFNNVNQSFNATTLNNTVSNFTLTDYYLTNTGTFWYWINCSDGIGTNVTANHTLTILDPRPNIYLINVTNASQNHSKYDHLFYFNISDPDNSTLSATFFIDSTNFSFNGTVLNNTLSNFSGINFTMGTHWFWIKAGGGVVTNTSLNYTITIVNDAPTIYVMETNGSRETESAIVRTFNYTDPENSTASCTLFIQNLAGTTTYNVSYNGTTFNNTLTNVTSAKTDWSNGIHWYWFKCSDGINTNVSKNYTLDLFRTGSATGGGGGTETPTKYFNISPEIINLSMTVGMSKEFTLDISNPLIVAQQVSYWKQCTDPSCTWINAFDGANKSIILPSKTSQKLTFKVYVPNLADFGNYSTQIRFTNYEMSKYIVVNVRVHKAEGFKQQTDKIVSGLMVLLSGRRACLKKPIGSLQCVYPYHFVALGLLILTSAVGVRVMKRIEKKSRRKTP